MRSVIRTPEIYFVEEKQNLKWWYFIWRPHKQGSREVHGVHGQGNQTGWEEATVKEDPNIKQTLSPLSLGSLS